MIMQSNLTLKMSQSLLYYPRSREKSIRALRDLHMNNNASQEDHLDTPAKEDLHQLVWHWGRCSFTHHRNKEVCWCRSGKRSYGCIYKCCSKLRVSSLFRLYFGHLSMSILRLTCTDAGYDAWHPQSCSSRLKVNTSAFKPIHAEENETEHN